MIKVTLHDILHRNLNELNPNHEVFCIYVIREETVVFYVGRSKNPFKRLLQHFDELPHSRKSGASIRPFYERHKDISDNWSVDLYTLEDCAHLLATDLSRGGSEYAERLVIQHFHPCLNEMNNPNSSPLPELYRERNLNLDDNAVDVLNW